MVVVRVFPVVAVQIVVMEVLTRHSGNRNSVCVLGVISGSTDSGGKFISGGSAKEEVLLGWWNYWAPLSWFSSPSCASQYSASTLSINQPSEAGWYQNCEGICLTHTYMDPWYAASQLNMVYCCQPLSSSSLCLVTLPTLLDHSLPKSIRQFLRLTRGYTEALKLTPVVLSAPHHPLFGLPISKNLLLHLWWWHFSRTFVRRLAA